MAAVVDKGVGVQYRSITRFTADLAERGVIVVGAESPFARAWDELEKCEVDAATGAHELGRFLADICLESVRKLRTVLHNLRATGSIEVIRRNAAAF
jgi:hypothetical protein